MKGDFLRVVTAQKGARDHYLIPRSLYRNGALAQCITDWHSEETLHQLFEGISHPLLRRVADAYVPEVPAQHISDQKMLGLVRKAAEKIGHIFERRHEAYAWTDALFARWVASLDLPPHTAFIGYSYASLEALEAEQARGVFTVVHQIDPGRWEWRLVQREAEKWPAYARPRSEEPDRYFRRAEQEWGIADLIVVNSEWSRQALKDQGVDLRKVEVLSLGYDTPSAGSESGRTSEIIEDQNPLTIVWIGSTSIRKGIQYFVEAARELQNTPFQFIVAGSIDIRREAVQAAPENIEWKGHIPHSEVPSLLRAADLHVLPTLSDGFGMTQIEALAHGTPVIATRNCGHVIDDGKTGLLIEPRSVEDLVDALLRLNDDRSLLAQMRSECVKAASRYSIDAYGKNLTALLRNRMPQVPDGPK